MKSHRLNLLLFILPFFFCHQTAVSQDRELDSLNHLLQKQPGENERMEIHFNIGSYWYGKGEYKKAIDAYQNIVDHCNENKQKCLDAKNIIAFNLIVLEEYKKAGEILKASLNEALKINYEYGLINVNRNLGLIHTYTGDYEEAAKLYLNAIEYSQKLKNKMKEADLYADLGMNYYFQDNYEKAAQYWEKAIEVKPDKNSTDYIGYCANLGQAYVQLKKYDKAGFYFLKAKEFYKDKNLQAYANALNGLGVLETTRNNLDKGLNYFMEELQVRESTGSRNDALASVYLNISSLLNDLKRFPESLEYAKKGLEKALLSDNKNELLHAYENINTIYSKVGNYEKAYQYSLMYNELHDSISNIESKKNINELDTKYQTVQKEKRNQELKQQIEIKEIESDRQRLMILFIGALLIALGIIAYVLIRQNKLKTVVNKELALKNRIIEEKSKIVREQHKDITDSINYAKRIQEAILLPMNLWEKTLQNSFVLYKPKDVLSGDFYWLYKTPETIFFAAADCTGHGVPGAMVSVVCSNALNLAVKEFGIREPGKILDKVRELVVETFEKSQSEVTDGMDISLCALQKNIGDKSEIILQWAGANNPLWYVHNKKLSEIKADKQPIGKIDAPRPFKTHIVQLFKGDQVYIFSDGYADQFGGADRKKFLYKRLKEKLVSICDLSPREQKEQLNQTFIEWKGSKEQVDDVCVIGIKLS